MGHLLERTHDRAQMLRRESFSTFNSSALAKRLVTDTVGACSRASAVVTAAIAALHCNPSNDSSESLNVASGTPSDVAPAGETSGTAENLTVALLNVLS